MSIDIKFRKLFPEDIDDIKKLCQIWFPIRYPDSWYIDITNASDFQCSDWDGRYYTQCAYEYNSHHIVGMLVVEIKYLYECYLEDSSGLLCTNQNLPQHTKVAYIMVLGVSEPFRKIGIASNLLKNLLAHIVLHNSNNVLFKDCLIQNSRFSPTQPNPPTTLAISYLTLVQKAIIVVQSMVTMAKINCYEFLHKRDLKQIISKINSTYSLSTNKGVNASSKLVINSTIPSNPQMERSNEHHCKVIYLHVLATNYSARKFYEKHKFKSHKFLPYYYNVPSGSGHAYLYVHYINGGCPPPKSQNKTLVAFNKMATILQWPSNNSSKNHAQ